MSARDDILQLLKQSDALTAADVGDATGLTSMGARGHLERLERDGLVQWQETPHGRGRPRRLWRLTRDGHDRFGDRHDRLTVELIGQVRQLFGDDGLNRLIGEREQQQRTRYQNALRQVPDSPQAKLDALAAERSREGYMAEVIATDGGWELIEHHCPICAAAETCQNFCRSELTVFRDSLGPDYEVERAEHLLSDGQRCRYAIKRREDE
ncbi:helix-turn-helix transcriptional regulator [Saccharospirillum mangrovi]|uniref:helix-turn-helix transcriptional regulator n=1 Tax=Saccharospirillum mangrovi TaxID=2161747 RepID=UPI000D35139E|nr:metalloregulator ArsR/SmtB family transcription factor [Saccharospirillum mangrovi]